MFLEQHGARATELAPEERFAAACAAGDRGAIDALLSADPGLVAGLGPARQTELVALAVAARRPEAIRHMAALGFALDTLARNTPMHDAAFAGELELVRLLVELGADPRLCDREYGSTPLGWADHNGQAHVVAHLRALTGEAE